MRGFSRLTSRERIETLLLSLTSEGIHGFSRLTSRERIETSCISSIKPFR